MKPRKIRRVLLVFPPATERRGSLRWCVPPLGLSYLAASLRPGREVVVLDAVVEGYHHVEPADSKRVRFGLPVTEIASRAIAVRPDFIGISCLFSSQMKVVADLVRTLKADLPGVPLALGGNHPTFQAAEIMRSLPELDFIVLGEGDGLLPGLLERLENQPNFTGMDGLAWRRDGRVEVRPLRGRLADVDSLPTPAWDLLPIGRYHRIGMPFNMTSRSRRFLPILSSRGCPLRCVFCSSTHFWRQRYRGRSPRNVLDEMEQNVATWGIREFQFSDDNLTHDRERARRIFQGILDRRLPITWTCPNGIAPWNLDEELLELMVRSGLYEIILSIESGNQEVLSGIMHKPTRLDKVPRVVAAARRLGIRVHGLFVIGVPGESADQIRDTFHFARSLELHGATFFVANPLPGSEMEKVCRARGLLPPDFSFDDLDYYCNVLPFQYVDGTPLSKLSSRESLRINLGAAMREPTRFAQKWGRLALSHPLALTRSLVSRMMDLIQP